MGGAYLRSRIKQAGKWDQETIVSFFLCQYCSGEYLHRSDYISTYGSQGPAGNILFTADKQEYRAEHGATGADNNYITHNNQVLYRGNSGLWLADDGRVVVSNNGGLFYVVMKDGAEKLEQFADYDQATTGDVWPLTTIWTKSGDYYLGTNCQVNRDNAGILEMPFFNS